MEANRDDGCSFCNIATGNTPNVQEYDRPIVENAEFFVVPALGQFTPGYVLICSRAHYPNLAIMESSLSPEFRELKDQVRTLLLEEYGREASFFEHGPASFNSRAGSCVEHAHLHAIPLDFSSLPSYISSHLDGGRIGNIHEVVEYSKAGNPYFFLESSDGDMFLYHAPLLPCQYGRQLLARALKVHDKWDWRTYPFFDQAAETGDRLRARMEGKRDDNHSRVLCSTG